MGPAGARGSDGVLGPEGSVPVKWTMAEVYVCFSLLKIGPEGMKGEKGDRGLPGLPGQKGDRVSGIIRRGFVSIDEILFFPRIGTIRWTRNARYESKKLIAQSFLTNFAIFRPSRFTRSSRSTSKSDQLNRILYAFVAFPFSRARQVMQRHRWATDLINILLSQVYPAATDATEPKYAIPHYVQM